MGYRVAILLSAAALAGCGGDDDETRSPPPPAASSSRCQPADSALMTTLGNALRNEQDQLTNGQSVKSRDHDIYFISAELDGPGLDDPGDFGTWATTSPGGDEAIYSVDELAKDHTTWGDATAIAGISMDDDGAKESRDCVSATAG